MSLLSCGALTLFHYLAANGSNLEDLAITLDAHTGHAGIRRSGLATSQIGHRLVAHYAPEAAKQDGSSFWPASDATIRRSWKQAAIDAHPRKDLVPLWKALKAVAPAKDRLRVEGLLDAMDGKLNRPAKREQLESAIKDRPNLSLLQLAAMPLPDEQEELLMEISRRLKIFGTLEFRDSNWNVMSVTDVPSIILSEAIHDVDRTVAGSSVG